MSADDDESNLKFTKSEMEQRHLIGVIGDKETVTGMLLAGIGNVDGRQRRNFFKVDNSILCNSQTNNTTITT